MFYIAATFTFHILNSWLSFSCVTSKSEKAIHLAADMIKIWLYTARETTPTKLWHILQPQQNVCILSFWFKRWESPYGFGGCASRNSEASSASIGLVKISEGAEGMTPTDYFCEYLWPIKQQATINISQAKVQLCELSTYSFTLCHNTAIPGLNCSMAWSMANNQRTELHQINFKNFLLV